VTTLYKKEIMAVNVDTVYQRVLAIANKEQRGYITPQEFNLLANQAQMDIFEQYFYDINQFERVPGNDTEYANMSHILQEKIAPFEVWKASPASTSGNEATLPTATYRLGTVFYAVGGAYDVEVEEITKKELVQIERSPLATPDAERPVYVRKTNAIIKLFPTTITIGNVTVNYIKSPTDVKWDYKIINDQALYNSTNSTDFELHESEETDLVIKILELSGLVIKDPGLYQIAAQEEIQKVQQEKL
tara:strand:- start:860 stop:1597 length:738 start_codon:yes stop_codon:yes gene_type:complete